jgi:hypothetical protein
MMNLNNIFNLNILDLWNKYNHIFSLEILWLLKGFKKITKLEPFTLEDLNNVKDILNKKWIKYIYFEKDEYFDEQDMLFKKWNIKWKQYIDIYLSKSNQLLEILKNKILIEENIKKKNYLIWKLLWYPDCCIKKFLENNYSSDKDFNIQIKENTNWKLDWRLNNLINPYSLIPFFPCSYNCEEAIKYAENNLEIIWNKKEIENNFKNILEYNSFWNYKKLNNNTGKTNNNIFAFT